MGGVVKAVGNVIGGVVKTVSKVVTGGGGGGGGGGGSPAPVVVQQAAAPAPAPTPTPAPPALAPSIDAARQRMANRQTEFMRKGRAATILTGAQGDLSSPTTSSGTKTLLGS